MKILSEIKSNQNYLILVHDTEKKVTRVISFNENEFDFLIETLNDWLEFNKNFSDGERLIIEFLKNNKTMYVKDFLELSTENQTYLLFKSKFIDFEKI